mmetsp:Transcript_21238/g.44354  ORF Transcript_21238/g.44354 Transcript_21238/m.44354 type:complete len:107 (+) Transcript_21238:191-511(+)
MLTMESRKYVFQLHLGSHCKKSLAASMAFSRSKQSHQSDFQYMSKHRIHRVSLNLRTSFCPKWFQYLTQFFNIHGTCFLGLHILPKLLMCLGPRVLKVLGSRGRRC